MAAGLEVGDRVVLWDCYFLYDLRGVLVEVSHFRGRVKWDGFEKEYPNCWYSLSDLRRNIRIFSKEENQAWKERMRLIGGAPACGGDEPPA